jgi:hypothetical protein
VAVLVLTDDGFGCGFCGVVVQKKDTQKPVSRIRGARELHARNRTAIFSRVDNVVH